MSSVLMPEMILSLSNCICQTAPNDWTIEWASYNPKNRNQVANSFGMNENELEQAIIFTTNEIEKKIGYPNVIFSLSDAIYFCQRFVKNHKAELLGLGLPEQYRDELMEDLTPEEGCGQLGIYQALKGHSRIDIGGELLGYEILNFDRGLNCSWLCNGLEKRVFRQLGEKPNSYGFLSDLEIAIKAAEYCSSEEVGAEPGLWLPCSVTKYQKEETER